MRAPSPKRTMPPEPIDGLGCDIGGCAHADAARDRHELGSDQDKTAQTPKPKHHAADAAARAPYRVDAERLFPLGFFLKKT
jgi:hypothetical protein